MEESKACGDTGVRSTATRKLLSNPVGHTQTPSLEGDQGGDGLPGRAERAMTRSAVTVYLESDEGGDGLPGRSERDEVDLGDDHKALQAITTWAMIILYRPKPCGP